MIILCDRDTLLHDTVELLGSKIIPALENSARIQATLKSIENSNHDLRYIQTPVSETSEEGFDRLLDLIRQTHSADYLEHLKEVFSQWRAAELIEQHESILPECFALHSSAREVLQPPKDIYARAGYFAFDMSSGIMDKSFLSIVASANLAVEAIRLLREEPGKDALALCRPPGHHCDGHKAGGYCYVNNAAVAISAWRQESTNARVAVLDIDFHHGNGTQEIFYTDRTVFYASIHGEDEFPYYTGRAEEKGLGAATGMNLNLPLETGGSFEKYLEKLDVAIDAIESFDAELLVVSLGFDTFHLDPLGSFKIYTEDYEILARQARQKLPSIPAIILLEGGYVLEHLGANVLSFLKGWEMAAH